MDKPEWQQCPVCHGCGIYQFASSSAVATRYSHPCHACTGSGMVPRPTVENVADWLKRLSVPFTGVT